MNLSSGSTSGSKSHLHGLGSTAEGVKVEGGVRLESRRQALSALVCYAATLRPNTLTVQRQPAARGLTRQGNFDALRQTRRFMR